MRERANEGGDVLASSTSRSWYLKNRRVVWLCNTQTAPQRVCEAERARLEVYDLMRTAYGGGSRAICVRQLLQAGRSAMGLMGLSSRSSFADRRNVICRRAGHSQGPCRLKSASVDVRACALTDAAMRPVLMATTAARKRPQGRHAQTNTARPSLHCIAVAFAPCWLKWRDSCRHGETADGGRATKDDRNTPPVGETVARAAARDHVPCPPKMLRGGLVRRARHAEKRVACCSRDVTAVAEHILPTSLRPVEWGEHCHGTATASADQTPPGHGIWMQKAGMSSRMPCPRRELSTKSGGPKKLCLANVVTCRI